MYRYNTDINARNAGHLHLSDTVFISRIRVNQSNQPANQPTMPPVVVFRLCNGYAPATGPNWSVNFKMSLPSFRNNDKYLAVLFLLPPAPVLFSPRQDGTDLAEVNRIGSRLRNTIITWRGRELLPFGNGIRSRDEFFLIIHATFYILVHKIQTCHHVLTYCCLDY